MRGSVYFIQMGEGGPIKIGFSKDPIKRLSELQIGNPVELKVILELEVGSSQEKYLHEMFAPHHIRGEWYHPDPMIIDFIEGMKSNQSYEWMYFSGLGKAIYIGE